MVLSLATSPWQPNHQPETAGDGAWHQFEPNEGKELITKTIIIIIIVIILILLLLIIIVINSNWVESERAPHLLYC